MSTHSIAEAQERLPDLIEEALAGQRVVIVQNGAPVIELTVVKPPEWQTDDPHGLDWLASRRRGTLKGPNAAELVSAMRDEDWR